MSDVLFRQGRLVTRRDVCKAALGALGASVLGPGVLASPVPEEGKPAKNAWKLDYIVVSCMYGKIKLPEILPELPRAGAVHIDVWPKPHGDQREQVDALGLDAFEKLLAQHSAKLGMLTRYDLGPFGLKKELGVAKRFGAKIIVTGSRGPKGLKGSALKSAVKSFADKLKPHVEAAGNAGVRIAIENHGSSLIDSADSQRWLVEALPSKALGIALAPYHLPQKPKHIAQLIRDLGPGLAHVYAWEHGKGCHKKMPKADELLQMPGRGSLSFRPILQAMREIRYSGWTEIFMHPTPRGIPILDTARQVTDEIIRAKKHLEREVAAL